MFRTLIAVVTAGLLVVGGVYAEDIQGVFKKYESNTLTITVPDKDGKDQTFKIASDLKIKQKNRKTGDETEVVATEMLEKMKEGQKLKVTTDDKGAVTNIQRAGRGKGKGN